MRKVAVISDSTCDLSREILDRYNISTFPLHIHLGEEQYSDGVDITPDEIFTEKDTNEISKQDEIWERLKSCSPKDQETALRILAAYLQSLD